MSDKPVPARYRDMFRQFYINGDPVVMTSVGPRSTLIPRWQCRQCEWVIKQNNAAAQSRIAKHVRQAAKERP